MTVGWICVACGNHYPAGDTPPASCLICTDERQWVSPDGQRWTTLAELATDGRRCDIGEVEPGLLGIGVTPPVGIGQRGLLIVTPAGVIQDMKIEETDGSTTDFTFSGIEENVAIPGSDFVFTPPRGIPVVDGQAPV